MNTSFPMGKDGGGSGSKGKEHPNFPMDGKGPYVKGGYHQPNVGTTLNPEARGAAASKAPPPFRGK